MLVKTTHAVEDSAVLQSRTTEYVGLLVDRFCAMSYSEVHTARKCRLYRARRGA